MVVIGIIAAAGIVINNIGVASKIASNSNYYLAPGR